MKTKQLLLFLFLLAETIMVASAEGIGPGKAVPSNNGATAMTFYAYKKTAAEQIAFSFIKSAAAVTGAVSTDKLTIKVYSPSGNLTYNQTILASNALNTAKTGQTASTEIGIWTFLIEQAGNFSIPYITDINVKATSTGATIVGRVYTERLNFLHGEVTNMSTFSVYSVNQQGYKYTSTFYNLYPIYISFVINPFGNVLAGTCTSAYKSSDSSDPRYAWGDNCGGASKIFLNTIAEDVPASAPRYNLTTNATVTEWLNPEIATENVTGLAYTPGAAAGVAAGSFTFNVFNYIGNATLQIDVDNNGLYTDAVDRSISAGVQQGANTIAFDGKDGVGNDIPCTATLKAKVVLDRPGEIHFVMSDAEGLGGIKITRTNGPSSPSSLINWDDTSVYTANRPNPTPILLGTNVNSSFTTTTHGWAMNAQTGWGNSAFIDNWAYLPGLTNQEITVNTLCRFPDLTPTTDIDELSFFTDGTSRDFIVNLYEIENLEATGQIRLRVTKLSAFTITYPTTNTVSNVFGGISNQNGNWTFAETSGFITATAKAGVTIPANGQALIGFNITRKAGTPPGNSQNITATIIGGSGGEINTTNNQVVTTVTAQ
ncbi:hypothetical protein [Dyadobacter diqingensis]|uniref:hypothetical protein n=1 Tax=Dyadobacter diqingensis TaxID=2938121 RepID=UPI0020C4BF94|nr:hypothetical protein [Dyadobacter diqingensis]